MVGRLQVLYGEVRRLVLSAEECSAPEVSIIVPMFSEGLNVLPHIVTEMKMLISSEISERERGRRVVSYSPPQELNGDLYI